VAFDDGRIVSARALVLAQGNQPPEPMRASEAVDGALVVNNPRGQEARAAIERVAADDGAVLVLGTGLTMIDLVLSLDAAGHRGRIVALSRRGQIPRSHAPHEPAPVAYDELPEGNVMALWRWLRGRSEAVGWRGAVDSLRPHAQALWRGLSVDEQRRFLRHARPYFDVHRHRIAPQVAAQLEAMVSKGRLEVVAGRLRSAKEEGGALAASYSRRNAPSDDLSSEHFGAIFNCTGPVGAMGRTRDPLLRQMIDEGIVAIDHLGMGISVNVESRAAEGVWALGPLTKGAFWEIVAVPDIREQVASVADQIARELEA
ncbi:MAG: FAD/NAD(P)-binding protein, partial [Sphingomicrobium sp.]